MGMRNQGAEVEPPETGEHKEGLPQDAEGRLGRALPPFSWESFSPKPGAPAYLKYRKVFAQKLEMLPGHLFPVRQRAQRVLRTGSPRHSFQLGRGGPQLTWLSIKTVRTFQNRACSCRKDFK